MDRMSALDSAFLHLEDGHSSLHIGSLALFEGPTPPQEQILGALDRRISAIPRLRQRPHHVPLSVGRPAWVDDPYFRLGDHVRRLAAPEPGGTAELHEVVDAAMAELLPHDRPLWDDLLVEGLADGRWALITRVHHSMADGIAGTDLLTAMLDSGPGGPETESARIPPPRTAPVSAPASGPVSGPASGTPTELVADAVADQARLRGAEVRRLAGRLRATVEHPVAAARTSYDVARGLAEFSRALVPTTVSSLVGPLDRERRFLWTEIDLTAALAVRHELGGTLNDVVLTIVTRGFRDLERFRGEHTSPRSVRCLVPVSVRAPGSATLDNEVSALLVTLPVELEDPRDRLNEVSIRMRRAKASHEAVAGTWATSVAGALPPTALAGFLHVAFRLPQRALTTVVTNVPGPSTTLYLAGRRMTATYPYVPIADRLRTGVAVTSYDGRLLFGITADRASTPDAAVLVSGIEAGFAELEELARPRKARR
ncbi:wax ester/triacylglycerol synthase family O-acyltransferase [Marmoricola sp. RAF53]|uniref:wax ester/triacylglycerol synthase family O-acyltransferase n=1 Tax=Marmoricola sp. RAF53 TaxID=3233059 RepID=UPI003F9DBBEA